MYIILLPSNQMIFLTQFGLQIALTLQFWKDFEKITTANYIY